MPLILQKSSCGHFGHGHFGQTRFRKAKSATIYNKNIFYYYCEPKTTSDFQFDQFDLDQFDHPQKKILKKVDQKF
jgi:hypothetical protein